MTAERTGYLLLDAGDGRRLEAFGERVVDRPAPVATGPRRRPTAWEGAHLRYMGNEGWEGPAEAQQPWPIALDELSLELRPTASGQVGLFPEHLASLPWLREQVELRAPSPSVLNLFGYTGLATLALASAGASVVHVDSARSAVSRARHNARRSSLDGRSIRWIVDDAAAFVAREVRRGRLYDGIVLDPPSWGHAGDAPAWRLEGRLAELLAACAELAAPTGTFCLLTGHTTGQAAAGMGDLLASAFRRRPGDVEVGPMEIRAESGTTLSLGAYARLAA